MSELADPWEGCANLRTATPGVQWELVDHVVDAALLPETVIRVRKTGAHPLLLRLPQPFRIWAELSEDRTLDEFHVLRVWQRYAVAGSRARHSLSARISRFHDHAVVCDYLLALQCAEEEPANFMINPRVINASSGLVCWDMPNYEAARRMLEMIKDDDREDRVIACLRDPISWAEVFDAKRSTDAYLWAQLPAIVDRKLVRSSVLALTSKVPAAPVDGTTVVLRVDTLLPPVLVDEVMQEILKSREGYAVTGDLCTVHTPALRVLAIHHSEFEAARPATRDRTHGVIAPPRELLKLTASGLATSTERKRKTVDEIASGRPAKTLRQTYFHAVKKTPLSDTQ